MKEKHSDVRMLEAIVDGLNSVPETPVPSELPF
jgi:hypothetical protein